MVMTRNNTSNIPIHFIVGSARSGTTLLSNIFNQHSEVVATTENDFLLYFLKDFYDADFTDPRVKKKLASLVKKRRKRVINIWDLEEDYISALQSTDGIKSYRQFCTGAYLHYGKKYYGKENVKIIIDKNPTYTIHLRTLLAEFPDSKFIALVRDYRDVISSQKRFFSLLKLIPIYGYMWTINNETIFECHKQNPGRILLVRYEDLVRIPEETIKIICSFLDVDFEPEMLNYHKNLSPVLIQIKKTLTEAQKKRVQEMFTLINQPVTSVRIGSSEKELKKGEIEIADFVAGPTAKKFGYQPKGKFSFWKMMVMHSMTLPVILMSIIQIKAFNYYYYYLPIRVRKIVENFNVPLVIKRWFLAYRN